MANTKKSLHVKTGDRVVITAGKDKGKQGNIKKAIPSEGSAFLMLPCFPLSLPAVMTTLSPVFTCKLFLVSAIFISPY